MAKTIWFKAKRYGWGWQPSTWQGWLITLAYMVIIVVHAIMIEWWQKEFGDLGIILWTSGLIGIACTLIYLCIAFGETPRWQWGGK